MKERQILFKGEMVRASLEGRKTQTRRILKHQPIRCSELPVLLFPQSKEEAIEQTGYIWPNAKDQIAALCPYGQPGDRLWVRETFDLIYGQSPPDRVIEIDYKADWVQHGNRWRMMDELGTRRWKPSIHMPRWASRIALEITGVRVERLQDISEADALAEGIESLTGDKTIYHWDFPKPRPNHAVSGYKSAQSAYKELWADINGRESLDANPWVWVIEFKIVAP